MYLYKRLSYDWDVDIFEYVQEFDIAPELSLMIESTTNKGAGNVSTPPVFFQKCDPQRFVEILNQIGSL